MRPNNSESLQFYNEPYNVELNETLTIGDTVETPVVVVNWDSEESPPKLYFEEYDAPFKVMTGKRPNSTVTKEGANQTTSREPTVVLLKLVKPITHLPITLKLIAELLEW
ncbi:hypothetical protein COOONC_28268 [Cooperia oncophora]